MTHSLSIEIQATREEFLRQLATARDDFDYEHDNNCVSIVDGGKRVLIDVTELGVKELGSLLAKQRLDFSFDNMSMDSPQKPQI